MRWTTTGPIPAFPDAPTESQDVLMGKPKVKWVALYPPRSEGARWTYNIAMEDGIGCGDLADTPSSASVEVAMGDFRRVLREHFDAPEQFDFEEGSNSWGATFA